MRRTLLRGFTLVELMVVLAIIGIVTGAMVAEMRGTMEDAALRETARKIMDACDATNARAVSTGRAHLLVFNTAEKKYSARPKGLPRAESSESARDSEISGAQGELDERIVIDIREPMGDEEEEEGEGEIAATRQRRARAEVITFYADGTADPREFFLRDRSGGELAMRINPITSRVRLVEEGAR